MADIELEPGEVFEHRHAGTSTTMLVRGAVRFVMAGFDEVLAPGQVVVVPAGVSHVTTNLGSTPAMVRCDAHPAPIFPNPPPEDPYRRDAT